LLEPETLAPYRLPGIPSSRDPVPLNSVCKWIFASNHGFTTASQLFHAEDLPAVSRGTHYAT